MHLGVRLLLGSKFSMRWVITCRNTFLKEESKSFFLKDEKFTLEIDFMD